MSDRQPAQIGKYQIVELVGEGAMGVVYRATDSVLGRTVAIKVMNASIARQEDLRQRFLREAQAAGSLQHPNVVTIYDLGELDGHLFIAMEYVHGTDLEKLMELREPLSLQSKLDIIIDVLTGLAYAHRRGIVHRDIKPANIRVEEDGRAKIMDFGVAHLASSSITRTGLVVGTPSYMAPEQVMGGKALPETDIFAVGAVLYQLLTGDKPFEAPTLQSLFYKIVTDMPRPVAEIMPGLPPALDRITRKALAKDPAQRYNTALEMANEITRVRAELSGAPYPATVSLETAAVTRSAAEAALRDETSAAPGSVPVNISSRRIPPRALGAAGVAGILLLGWVALARGRNPTVNESGLKDSELTQAAPASASVNDSIVASVPSATGPGQISAKPTGTAPAEPAASPSASAAAPETRAVPTERRPDKSLREKQSTIDRVREAMQKKASQKSATPPERSVTRPAPSVRAPAVAPPPVIARQAPRDIGPRVPAALPVRPQPAPPPDPTPPKVENAASEIAGVVAAYARAIESRDIAAVRRAYPGLTAEQARGFEQFFESTRSINVTFRVVGLETSGNSADARLVGTYEYTTTGSRTEKQPVSFAATLRSDGSSWRLVSVR
ncbi:MAG TPA: protein kinase [Gemmatimonadaceae bacterium]|nr:protein kinase [Gemmatimonadaceae bacterium]